MSSNSCRRVAVSPAGAFSEDDEVLVLGRAFDELDTGEVLPVAHGLLEEGLVGAGEVGLDLVRDDAVVPHALLARRGRSPTPP